MLCYRDKTYCTFWRKCKHGSNCHRKLDKGVAISAKKVNMPICRFIDKPDCFVNAKGK